MDTSAIEPAEEGLMDAPEDTSGNLVPENHHGSPEASKKKKKKKKKKKNTEERGPTALPKSRGSGFEPYFADPPRTAEEAQEEAKLYSADRPFHDRIEECIQRFCSRRRIEALTKQCFDLYLFLGGIDTSPRQFGGNVDTTDMDKEETRQATADAVIQRGGGSQKYYTPGEDGWTVDFYNVAAGYLSFLPRMLSDDFDLMEKAISVVENFLRYVQHHDVCPEYADDVQRALDLCNKACTDIPRVVTAAKHFPGEFNLACIEKYFPDDMPILHEDDGLLFKRPDNFNPKVAINMGVLAHDRASFVFLSTLRPLGKSERDVEIVSIIPPDETAHKIYGAVAMSATNRKYQVTGRIKVRPCFIETGWWKSTDPEESQIEKEWDFILDANILAHLRTGMKMHVLIGDLSNGMSVILQISSILVPWNTFLPQMLMRNWREPCPDYRPARSVHDPPLEDGICDPFEDDDLDPER